MRNYFITLEGGEGVGKSTAIAFIKHYFMQKQAEFIVTREPGGTPVAEAIRAILLNQSDEIITPETELLLMFASRAQHIAHVIRPALNAGKTVISDRFTDASFAYQGGGRSIPGEYLQVLEKCVHADTLQPNLTLLFDAPIEIGLSRVDQRGDKDRIEIEKTDFFQRVRNAYLARAQQDPARFAIIDATQSIENVQAQIYTALERLEHS